MVFPFGMYAVSSIELGTVAHAPWIHAIGLGEAWLALVTWCMVFLSMLAASLPRAGGRATGPP